jgi:hypothetical protein
VFVITLYVVTSFAQKPSAGEMERKHFEKHLNEGHRIDLRDDEGDIDLPSREEIAVALKYLKNNKAASAHK